MSGNNIVDSVVQFVETEAAAIKNELGIFGNTLVLAFKHDIEVLGGDAKALVAQDVNDLWDAAKAQIAQEWNNLPGTFEEKVVAGAALLKNIDWSMVSKTVIGLSESTLLTLARTAGQMAIAGVIAAI